MMVKSNRYGVDVIGSNPILSIKNNMQWGSDIAQGMWLLTKQSKEDDWGWTFLPILARLLDVIYPLPNC